MIKESLEKEINLISKDLCLIKIASNLKRNHCKIKYQ